MGVCYDWSMICYIDYRKQAPTTAHNASTSVPSSGRWPMHTAENCAYGTWYKTSTEEYETPNPGKTEEEYETPNPNKTGNKYEAPIPGNTQNTHEVPNNGKTEDEYETPNPGNAEEENIYEAIPN